MTIWRAFIHTDLGQSVVEFALVTPLFLLMTLGLFDLGRGIYYYNSLSNLAREGARAGIVLQDDNQWLIAGNTAGKDSPQVYSNVSSYAGTNTIVGRIASEATMFDLTQMTVSLQAINGTIRYTSSRLTVKVQYPFSLMLATWLNQPPTFNLTAQTTMIIE